jgi:hypothetical protein
MGFSGKHTIAVIGGVRCTLVESGISESRMQFLKSLLELNSYQVKIEKEESENYKIGVTDLLFNPVVDVYKRRMKTSTGHILTPAYWLQLSTAETENEVNYWIQK